MVTATALLMPSFASETKAPLKRAFAWKSKLKQACLERARKRQRSDEELASPSAMIAHEMQQQRVRLQLDEDPMDDFDEAEYYCMTEDEWIELLEEVEEEMERAKAQWLDQVIEDERNQIEQQVADFEYWQEADGEEEGVFCPVCKDASLSLSMDGSIVCPNAMDGSCAVQLSYRPGLDLDTLRSLLSSAYEQHGRHCLEPLGFDTVVRGPETMLRAVCLECQTCHEI